MRYIDAEDFYKRQAKRCNYNRPIIGTCTMDNITLREALKKQPTADVVEVRHGEWKRVRWVKCDDPDGGYWIVRCNQCGIPHIKEYKFCPSCGAKMDGKSKNELLENPEQLDLRPISCGDENGGVVTE